MIRALAMTLLVLVSFSAGLLASPAVIGTAQAAQRGEQPPEFRIFWETWGIVHDNFVFREELDTTALTYGAIRGMLEALGDEGHTRFLTPDQLNRQRERQRGSIEGIGIEYKLLDSRPVVIRPIAGSPASKAGIRPGDVILEVDGEDTFGWNARHFAGRIRGAPGTPVTLRVAHIGESRPVKMVIFRALIRLSSVGRAMVPGTEIGLIKLGSFYQGASDDIEDAIRTLRDTGATSVILDLRNNPGGLLREAIHIAGHFLGDATVLQQEDRFGRRRPLRADGSGNARDLNLVVLVNGRSASASEILAGSIQDNRRGHIVGETTIGTGTVLSLFELEDGSAVLVGIAQWLTPNGRAIRNLGITPDIEVANEADDAWLTPADVAVSTRSTLLAGDDLQLTIAIRRLLPVTNKLPGFDWIDIPSLRSTHYP